FFTKAGDTVHDGTAFVAAHQRVPGYLFHYISFRRREDKPEAYSASEGACYRTKAHSGRPDLVGWGFGVCRGLPVTAGSTSYPARSGEGRYGLSKGRRRFYRSSSAL